MTLLRSSMRMSRRRDGSHHAPPSVSRVALVVANAAVEPEVDERRGAPARDAAGTPRRPVVRVVLLT